MLSIPEFTVEDSLLTMKMAPANKAMNCVCRVNSKLSGVRGGREGTYDEEGDEIRTVGPPPVLAFFSPHQNKTDVHGSHDSKRT